MKTPAAPVPFARAIAAAITTLYSLAASGALFLA